VEEKVAVGEVENGREFRRSAVLLFRRVKWRDDDDDRRRRGTTRCRTGDKERKVEG
jgi:hypothetical protein